MDIVLEIIVPLNLSFGRKAQALDRLGITALTIRCQRLIVESLRCVVVRANAVAPNANTNENTPPTNNFRIINKPWKNEYVKAAL